jgi:flavin-dependent dehydrogenase
MGHQVLVVEREQFPRPHVGEALTPGTWSLLEMLNMRQPVEDAGFVKTTTSLVRWEDAETRMVKGASGPGLNVDRGRFDEILLCGASVAGASILQPAIAGHPLYTDEGWEVPVRTQSENIMIRTGFLADASGRAFVLRGPRQRTSARTLALCGTWRLQEVDDAMTRIQTTTDAWFWGAHMPGAIFKAMVFVDKSFLRERNVTRAGLEACYRELVDSSFLLDGFENTRFQDKVTVYDATCYADADPVGETFIKLGDAAFTIDPLSSAGVQKALQSALAGSVVAHTLISGKGDTSAALEFFRESQQSSVEQHARWASGYYHQNTVHRHQPFWRNRAKAPFTVRPFFPDRRLQELLPYRVTLSADTSIKASPCIVGNIVERRPTLYHPSLARPVAYLDGVELARLLKPLELGLTLNEILTIWSRELTPGRALAVAGWLHRRGIIVRLHCGEL